MVRSGGFIEKHTQVPKGSNEVASCCGLGRDTQLIPQRRFSKGVEVAMCNDSGGGGDSPWRRNFFPTTTIAPAPHHMRKMSPIKNRNFFNLPSPPH